MTPNTETDWDSPEMRDAISKLREATERLDQAHRRLRRTSGLDRVDPTEPWLQSNTERMVTPVSAPTTIPPPTLSNTSKVVIMILAILLGCSCSSAQTTTGPCQWAVRASAANKAGQPTLEATGRCDSSLGGIPLRGTVRCLATLDLTTQATSDAQ